MDYKDIKQARNQILLYSYVDDKGISRVRDGQSVSASQGRGALVHILKSFAVANAENSYVVNPFDQDGSYMDKYLLYDAYDKNVALSFWEDLQHDYGQRMDEAVMGTMSELGMDRYHPAYVGNMLDLGGQIEYAELTDLTTDDRMVTYMLDHAMDPRGFVDTDGLSYLRNAFQAYGYEKGVDLFENVTPEARQSVGFYLEDHPYDEAAVHGIGACRKMGSAYEVYRGLNEGFLSPDEASGIARCENLFSDYIDEERKNLHSRNYRFSVGDSEFLVNDLVGLRDVQGLSLTDGSAERLVERFLKDPDSRSLSEYVHENPTAVKDSARVSSLREAVWDFRWKATFEDFCRNLDEGKLTHESWLRSQQKKSRDGDLLDNRAHMLESVLMKDWSKVPMVGIRNSVGAGDIGIRKVGLDRVLDVLEGRSDSLDPLTTDDVIASMARAQSMTPESFSFSAGFDQVDIRGKVIESGWEMFRPAVEVRQNGSLLFSEDAENVDSYHNEVYTRGRFHSENEVAAYLKDTFGDTVWKRESKPMEPAADDPAYPKVWTNGEYARKVEQRERPLDRILYKDLGEAKGKNGTYHKVDFAYACDTKVFGTDASMANPYLVSEKQKGPDGKPTVFHSYYLSEDVYQRLMSSSTAFAAGDSRWSGLVEADVREMKMRNGQMKPCVDLTREALDGGRLRVPEKPFDEAAHDDFVKSSLREQYKRRVDKAQQRMPSLGAEAQSDGVSYE